MENKKGYEKDMQWLLAEKYHGEKTEGFFTDCARLQTGKPLAYLIGHVPFLNTIIYLDSHPLIPRAETEFWVEKMIQEISASLSRRTLNSDARAPYILDLCAGSGCIGVTVLKAIPSARVDFAEIDARHHTIILKNIVENGVDPARARIFGGDLFSEISAQPTQYDYILTNPPYIDPQKEERIEKSVFNHEPHEALFGGIGGLEFIHRILKEAPTFLIPRGALYIEHEPEQVDAIKTYAREFGYTEIESFSDQYDVTRTTRLRYQ